MSGCLYLVGVPIGHVEDITFRAVKTLEKVDIIAAEDTRKAKRLLADLGIRTSAQVIAHGSHNEHQSLDGIAQLLLSGKNVAYISDAGMPGISDPGYLLVRKALDIQINVQVIPGITALTTAISISGLSSDRFAFYGFLPKKTGDRQKALSDLAHLPFTLGFYESPRRVLDMLKDVHTIFGERNCVLARELTKTYEEFIRQPLSEAIQTLSSREEILGEFTVLVEGISKESLLSNENINALITEKLSENMRVKDIQKELAPVYPGTKQELYKCILDIKANM